MSPFSLKSYNKKRSGGSSGGGGGVGFSGRNVTKQQTIQQVPIKSSSVLKTTTIPNSVNSFCLRKATPTTNTWRLFDANGDGVDKVKT